MLVALRSALSCYNLEPKAGKGNRCYIEENAELDRDLVNTMSKCTTEDIAKGTPAAVSNASICYVRTFIHILFVKTTLRNRTMCCKICFAHI